MENSTETSQRPARGHALAAIMARVLALSMLGLLAGVLEHYITRMAVRFVPPISPVLGAIVAGTLAGLLLRLKKSWRRPFAALLLLVLLARLSTLYMDYLDYRARRTEALVASERMAEAIAVQKLAQQGYEVKHAESARSDRWEAFANDLRQLTGRADFFGYLKLELKRGLRTRYERLRLGPTGVAVPWIIQTFALGASALAIGFSAPLRPKTDSPATLNGD